MKKIYLQPTASFEEIEEELLNGPSKVTEEDLTGNGTNIAPTGDGGGGIICGDDGGGTGEGGFLDFIKSSHLK